MSASQPSQGPRATIAFRRIVLIALLAGLMVLLHRFAVPSGAIDPTGMLALGFVVLACYALGELVGVVGLPHITGYLVAGMLLGPSVAGFLGQWWSLGPFADGVLNEEIQDQLHLFESLALALIALTAGGELKLSGLRQGLKSILGVLAGQTLLVPLAGVVVVAAMGATGALGASPGLLGILGLGLAVGAISLATSPAATIAVITGSGAKGPMTRTVLSAVVLKDVVVVVLFSVATALTAAALGSGGEGSVALDLLVHVGGSLVGGAVVGGMLALYLRYVGAEKLLALVFTVFVATWLAGRLHLSPMLLFMAAGFTTANFSQAGDTLIHEVERLSTPVYVVFFTLVGAHLPLDSLGAMAGWTVALVGLRALALWGGTTLGARVARAERATRAHGWLGFVSQAGVGIGLATELGTRFAGQGGEALYALLIAGVAVHELAGPVLLDLGLRQARETQARRPEAAEAPEPVEVVGPHQATLAPWLPPEGVADPWGPRATTASPELDAALNELEGELQGLVRDLLQGPLERLRTSSHSYLRSLRREYLRHHRRALRLAEAGESDLATRLRTDQSELAEHWRTLVLDRAATLGRRGWSPQRMLQAVDRMAEDCPEHLMAPVEADSLPSREESLPKGLGRSLLRARIRTRQAVGLDVQRRVPLRAVARYHLSGRGPGRLEGLAALLVNGQEHLVGRTRSLFDGAVEGYDAAAVRLDQGEDPAAVVEALWRARESVEEEFELASQEVEAIVQEGALRAARILGELLQAIKADALVVGTLDLPRWSRRYSLVFSERTAAMEVLSTGVDQARRTAASRYSVLALELELVGLEGRIKQAVETHASKLGRTVRGRTHTQLRRVLEGLEPSLGTLEAALGQGRTGEELAGAIREVSDPLEHVIAEATRSAQGLQVQLAAEQAVSSLLDALLKEARSLTERYTVPVGSPLRGEWKLSTPVPTAEVPFRDLVVAYVETSVTRDLLALTREMAARVQGLLENLEELSRVVAFNVELAGAELEIHRDQELPEGSRDLVKEMVLGALRRVHVRLAELEAGCEPWDESVRDGIRDAVLSDLEDLRGQAVDGKVSELRLRLGREAAAGRRLVEDAGRLGSTLGRLQAQVSESVRLALGEDRIRALRARLGLAEPTRAPTRFGPGDFDAPEAPAGLPVVYRRLFSDRALEAGDLLIGRQEELTRVRAALSTRRPGSLRSAAVVGPHGVGKGAVIQALVRSLESSRVIVHDLEGPTDEEQVDAWFSETQDGELHVLDGFEWLYTLRPGGFRPLRRFVEGVIADRGRSVWLVEAESQVWRFASRVVPMADAFPEVVDLRPLDPERLADAVLARHKMSGYKLHFEAETDIGWQLRHLVSRGRDWEERRREAWFHVLHASTDGIIYDALRLWMAAIHSVSEEQGIVHVGQVPRPPFAALEQLPEDILLTLRQVMRQGWLTPELHAYMFRSDRSASASHLARLAHWGLLYHEDGAYFLADHLSGPVHRALRRRGWQ